MKFWQPIGTAPEWMIEMRPPQEGAPVRAVTLGEEDGFGLALVYWDGYERRMTFWARIPRPEEDH